eukprot:357138-Chlamydomonas_euryale.AAC.3
MADADDVVCLYGPRPLRQTACGTKDLTPVQALDVLQKAKQNGNAKYWNFFRPVISGVTGLACLQCTKCEAELRASNPARTAGEHGQFSPACWHFIYGIRV